MSLTVSAARAGFTLIEDSPDQYDEPNLVGVNPFPDNVNPSVLESLYGEVNLRRVDDGHDIAFRHTGDLATVKAVAHFTSSSGVFGYLPNRAEPRVSVLNVLSPLGGYEPRTAGPGLIDLAESGPVFELFIRDFNRTSNPVRNPNGSDQLVTFEIVGNDAYPDNSVGSFVLAWEDKYLADSDRDYQDFVFEISGVTPVPEPVTLLLSCVAVVMLGGCRKRRSRAASPRRDRHSRC